MSVASYLRRNYVCFNKQKIRISFVFLFFVAFIFFFFLYFFLIFKSFYSSPIPSSSNNRPTTIVLPLVGFFVVTLNLKNCRYAVVSTDGKYHVVDNFNGKVTTRIVHVWYGTPCVSRWIIFFACTHS